MPPCHADPPRPPPTPTASVRRRAPPHRQCRRADIRHDPEGGPPARKRAAARALSPLLPHLPARFLPAALSVRITSSSFPLSRPPSSPAACSSPCPQQPRTTALRGRRPVGPALWSPGVRGHRGAQFRSCTSRFTRLDQGRAGGQRAAGRGLPRGVLPHRAAGAIVDTARVRPSRAYPRAPEPGPTISGAAHDPRQQGGRRECAPAVGICLGSTALKHKAADGKRVTAHAYLVFIDDPQDEEAVNPKRAIQPGVDPEPRRPRARRSPGWPQLTVIRRGDMADSLLDRKKHPEWKGERFKMVYAFPTNETLWNKYAEMYRESLAEGRNGEEATAFYLQHRLEMDEGARVYWPERYNPDEISAIQHAMNRRIIDEFAFMAECQNPTKIEAAEEDAPDGRGDRRAASTGTRRLLVPAWDVAGDGLRGRSQGPPVLAGRRLGTTTSPPPSSITVAIPTRGAAYWTLRDAKRTLAKAHPGGMEAHRRRPVRAAGTLLSREWSWRRRKDRKVPRGRQLGRDDRAGVPHLPHYEPARGHPHPSHGKGITASW